MSYKVAVLRYYF